MDMNKVASGLSRKKLIFGADGAPLGATPTPSDRIDLAGAVETVSRIKPLSKEDLDALIAWYQGYPSGERLVVVRHGDVVMSEVQDHTGGNVQIVAPSVSDARTNRGTVLRAGPRAMIEMRLERPRNGTDKVTIDLRPGDVIEFGIYAVGEIPVAMRTCPLKGKDILIVSVRDVHQVISSHELGLLEGTL